MTLMKIVVLLFIAVTLTSCVSTSKVIVDSPVGTENVSAETDDDPTMVTVVNAARLPASAGSLALGKNDIPVHVEAQLQKSPGDDIQFGSILFYVKSNRRIAGIINGNSAGSDSSKKFTGVVSKIFKEGAKPQVTSAIIKAQTKLDALGKTQPTGDLTEETFVSIRKILLEANRTILAAY